ncbi:MAG: hypothetical protein HYR94_23565 [Chloroflexi bacterium]|nr:hypothetical protein [Chloroflexota bacterium]
MEQLLWNFEDVKRFTSHSDAPLRSWAVDRLIKLFPDQAGEVLVTMLDDQGRFIANKTLGFLAKTGEPEKYGPILLEHLQRAAGEHFGRLAMTLAGLGYRPALPVILAYLHQDDQRLDFSEFLSLTHALGEFGGDEARQMLWALLEQARGPTEAVSPLMNALLQTAQPEDIPRLIRHYRTLPFDDGWHSPLSAFAATVEAARLVEEIRHEVKNGLSAMLERAEWWLGEPLSLSASCLDDLKQAFDNNYSGLAEILLRELRRLVEERGDDVAGWQAAWAAGERPLGYRRRVLYTLLILAGLAEPSSPDLAQRRRESALGLGLLTQLSIESDDQARLETAADKTEALLAILTQSREHILPEIVERVVALGPEMAPRLIDLLDPEDFGWGTIRIAHVLEHLARLHPGSCDAAISKLIACIHEEQGDYMKQAASTALEAIGPPAVELINKQLRQTRDMSHQIYLTGVLGEIPVESATQVILEKIKAGKPVEEMELSSLTDIGSASAIEPLYRMWKPGDHLLAEFLLILCELNGVQKPELPEWRRLVEAEEKRLARAMSGEVNLLEGLKNLAGPLPPIPTWQLEQKKPKALSDRKNTLSKKEMKKRAAQRKAVRGKKKKHRK